MDKSQQESPVRKPKVTINSTGHQKIPIIGIGTAANLLNPLALNSAVPEAIGLGYRHFDTAKLRRSDLALGEAIAEAVDLGLVSSRDELFVTLKLWCSDAHSDLIVSALRESLVNLQLEYLDLYLIHWPISAKPGKFQHPTPEGELLTMGFKSAWEAVNARN